jgi:LEA14-like dessication related protein
MSLAACGMLPPADLKPPKVTFSGFTVNGVGLERTRFIVRIAAQNPNRIDIPLANVRFALSVFGQPLAAGTVPEQRVTLPAGASTEVPVEFTVATADIAALLRKVTNGPWPGDAVWELKGSAHWGDSPFAVPFERRGDSDSLRRLRDLLAR